jgi:hypothetical protein
MREPAESGARGSTIGVRQPHTCMAMEKIHQQKISS